MSPIKPGAIDCDVHVEPPSMDVLLGYIDPYWHEFIRSAHLGVRHRLYPESEPMSARPEARAAGSFPPHTYEELRAQLLDPYQPLAVILTCVATFQGSRNPYFEAAMTTAVNNWMRDEFLDRDERLRGSIVVPSLSPGGRGRGDRPARRRPPVRAGAAAGPQRDAVGERALPPDPRGGQPEPAADHPARVGRLGNGADVDGNRVDLLRGLPLQLADHRAEPGPQPGRRGRLRPVPGPARLPRRARLRLAPLAAVALRQGLEGAVARDPVGARQAVRLRAQAPAGDDQPDADPGPRARGRARAAGRHARRRAHAPVLERLPARSRQRRAGEPPRRPRRGRAGRPSCRRTPPRSSTSPCPAQAERGAGGLARGTARVTRSRSASGACRAPRAAVPPPR